MKRSKCIVIVLLFNYSYLISCSQNSILGPGYKWELFEGTSNWNLAQAVSNEDTARIYKIGNSVNINLQESRFGKTLLMLAVGNDKLLSTEALLKLGADVNIRDSTMDQAIHEATHFIKQKRNSYNIIKLLIGYHADVNSVSTMGISFVPLEDAVNDLECTKLLLDKGANLYYRANDSAYSIWRNMCSFQYDDIYVARYLIIEKQLLVPNPILYTLPNHKPRTLIELLNLLPKSNEVKKEKAKDEIISYLRQIDFPKNGIYQDVSFLN